MEQSKLSKSLRKGNKFLGYTGEVNMKKVIILTVPENEESIFSNIQTYLQLSEYHINVDWEQNTKLMFQNLEIDLYHREVRLNKKSVRLTDLEFRLLHYLASQPGRVFSYQQIYETVWGEEYAREKGNIMFHIRHIRQKLEVAEDFFDYIENIRGVGYRFKKPVTDSA